MDVPHAIKKNCNGVLIFPVFSEAESLGTLYDRVLEETGKVGGIDWTFIFVNDGSLDNSLEVIRALAKLDSRVRAVDLSRNFGKEIALTAGVYEAGDADFVICIDADLQHPPALIPKLVSEWRKGVEVVVTIRESTKNQSLFRKIGSDFYYWAMRKFTDLGMVANATDFRLVDKKVIDAFKLSTERERIFRGVVDWLGFIRSYVYFQADQREGGSPRITYRKLLSLAITSLFSYSLWPLRVAAVVGICIASVSGLLLGWMLISYFVLANSANLSPLAIFVVTNTFLIGLVLLCLGFAAIYIGKIHREVVNRPLFIIRERINFD